MDELGRMDKDQFKSSSKYPLIVLLDNVRSMHNVGSIFRTADAFGIQELVLSGFTPKPPHRDIQKAALGATETVTWQSCDEPINLISEYKNQGFRIIALEQTTNATDIDQFSNLNLLPILLILGNEINGVSDDLLAHCDEVLEIPQHGTKHSLNVSVSAGIAMREILKSYLVS